MGELTIARERFEQSLALYRPEMHDSQIAQYGTDLGVAGHCYHALTLWHLGYPDQAVEESYRSITLAQDGAHPFSQAYALFVSAWVHHLRRDVSATQTQAEAAIRLATEQELPYWAALSGLVRGWSLALQGEGTAGITEIAQSLAAVRTLGQKMSGTLLLSMLAEAYGRNGQREAEQTVLTEALELVDENDERAYDARSIVNLFDTYPVWQSCGMRTVTPASHYKNHRFPTEIISHAVWLYFRFCLSFRAVEELLLERGVIVTYEAIRKWCRKFGQQYATQLRRRRPQPGDKWHLDEVFLTIKGEHHYLWRAVDQAGNVLDILVQRRRDKKAAKKFFRKLLKGLTYVPRVIVTDKLQSYGAAKQEILLGVEHRQHRYLNNRVENPHQPTRQRERRMQRFKSPGHARRFLSAYGPIAQHFRPRRHRFSAPVYRQELTKRFQIWREITIPALAA